MLDSQFSKIVVSRGAFQNHHVHGIPSSHDSICYRQASHDIRYAINADKIKGELGFEPIDSFESGLQEPSIGTLTMNPGGWRFRMTSGSYIEN